MNELFFKKVLTHFLVILRLSLKPLAKSIFLRFEDMTVV